MKLSTKLFIVLLLIGGLAAIGLVRYSSNYPLSSSSGAQNSGNSVAVTLTLKSLQAIKLSENSGDELYFSITKYSNQNDAEDFRVPSYPTHWLSKHLDKVADVVLWRGEIQEKETIELIISLLEHDLPIWDIDDHLGSIQLILENNQGQLVTNWQLVRFQDGAEIKVNQIEGTSAYEFISESSGYKVDFDLQG